MKTIDSHATRRTRLPAGPLSGLCPACLFDSSLDGLAPAGATPTQKRTARQCKPALPLGTLVLAGQSPARCASMGRQRATLALRAVRRELGQMGLDGETEPTGVLSQRNEVGSRQRIPKQLA
ncbi:MAG: hypothetical protein DMF60_04840 [Acidobacteria bacterium]|nr:MAG: hypothetical protein DMF60_04840 [Acidobacteriota bacterium]